MVRWERASITLYRPETDFFRFYAVETDVLIRILQRDAVISREGSAVGWVYDHRKMHVRPDLRRERRFLEDHGKRHHLGASLASPCPADRWVFVFR